jgi:rhodanese-related sulfurtransferase
MEDPLDRVPADLEASAAPAPGRAAAAPVGVIASSADAAAATRADVAPRRAGDLPPTQAWSLLQSGQAVLVDVRTAEELALVGRVPGAVHVPWAHGVDMIPNTRFLDELRAAVPPGRPLLFLCRSGKRSERAADAAARAGHAQAFNVIEGFDGEIDAAGRRGRVDGWRFHGLPWEQD